MMFALHGKGPGFNRGVMVEAFDCVIVVSKFELQSRHYVHFWTNTHAKGMNPFISQVWVK